ncbi:hypothetical protein AB1Y20_007872 [Prymnesium parvum]|uniref:Uncharacterized protein n=1 Tax=Prymnesium parvum TaxID=97485 RepID=A0AB34IT25_PRYPA
MAERHPSDPLEGGAGGRPDLISWDLDRPTDQTPAVGFSHSTTETAEPPSAHNTTLGVIEQMPSQPFLAVPLSYPELPATGAHQSASIAVPSFQSSLVTRAAELAGESTAAPVQPLVNPPSPSQTHPPSASAFFRNAAALLSLCPHQEVKKFVHKLVLGSYNNRQA